MARALLVVFALLATVLTYGVNAEDGRQLRVAPEMRLACLGDVNGDGLIDALDTASVLQYIMNRPVPDWQKKWQGPEEVPTLEPEYFPCADLNGDEDLTIEDVVELHNLVFSLHASQDFSEEWWAFNAEQEDGGARRSLRELQEKVQKE